MPTLGLVQHRAGTPSSYCHALIMTTLHTGEPISEECSTQLVLRGVLQERSSDLLYPLLQGYGILVGGVWTWGSMNRAIWQ